MGFFWEFILQIISVFFSKPGNHQKRGEFMPRSNVHIGKNRPWPLLLCIFFLLMPAGCVFRHHHLLRAEQEPAAGTAELSATNRSERPPVEEPKPVLPVSIPAPEPPEPPDPPQPPKPETKFLEPLRAGLTGRFGIALDGTENGELLRAVAEWMGAPYEWGGCSVGGIDCSCLVQTIYAEVFGLDINRTVRTMLLEPLEKVDVQGLREGDLLFFDMKDEGIISHVGIYLKSGAFVHASSSKGVMINRLTQPFYRNRLARAARMDPPSPRIKLAGVSLGNLVVLQP
jgi:cell wall-associated NlpC family hydrolase